MRMTLSISRFVPLFKGETSWWLHHSHFPYISWGNLQTSSTFTHCVRCEVFPKYCAQYITMELLAICRNIDAVIDQAITTYLKFGFERLTDIMSVAWQKKALSLPCHDLLKMLLHFLSLSRICAKRRAVSGRSYLKVKAFGSLWRHHVQIYL